MKICENTDCKKEFEPENNKGRFCCNNCKMKVYRKKEKPITEEIANQIKEVVSVSQLPPKINPEIKEHSDWVFDICNRKKSTVDDFKMWCEENFKEEPKIEKYKGKREPKDVSSMSYFERRQKGLL